MEHSIAFDGPPWSNEKYDGCRYTASLIDAIKDNKINHVSAFLKSELFEWIRDDTMEWHRLLMESICRNRNTITHMLLEYLDPSQVDLKNRTNNTLLSYAIIKSSKRKHQNAIIRRLLAMGADPNLQCGRRKENTPTNIAWGRRDVKILKLLLPVGGIIRNKSIWIFSTSLGRHLLSDIKISWEITPRSLKFYVQNMIRKQYYHKKGSNKTWNICMVPNTYNKEIDI